MPSAETVAQSWPYSNRIRVGFAALCGVAAGFASLALRFPPLAPLVGWDVSAAVYVLWVVVTIFRLNPEATAELATSEDPDRFTADVIILFASLASLGAVGMTLVEAAKAKGPDEFLLAATGVVSVVLSWLAVHTVYALRYARLYYDECQGGIDFNSDDPPTYAEFAYLAFTIGMTYQVSDTSISNRLIRRTVLRHALLSFLFGTVIVATTINLVAGLGN